jgi:hypothetical protein
MSSRSTDLFKNWIKATLAELDRTPGLSDWERGFVRDLASKSWFSPRQREIVAKMRTKYRIGQKQPEIPPADAITVGTGDNAGYDEPLHDRDKPEPVRWKEQALCRFPSLELPETWAELTNDGKRLVWRVLRGGSP